MSQESRYNKSEHSRATVFLIAFFLGFFSSASHADSDFGVCRLLYHNYIYENIYVKEGQVRAELYDRIFMNDYLHRNKNVRRLIYEYLSKSPAHEEILTQMEQMLPNDLERIAQLLKSLRPRLRTHILSSQEEWENWIERKFSAMGNSHSSDSRDINNYVLIDGAKVYQKNYRKLQNIKFKLERRGVFGHLASGPELSREGEAVLVIDRVEKRSVAPKLRPNGEVLKSAEFEGFLATAQRQNGAIVIHPIQNEAHLGYFWKNPDVVPGKDWVIALRPDSTGSTFLHEWQHKVDRIDEAARYKRSLISSKLSSKNLNYLAQGPLRMAIQNTGAQLEKAYLTELNATAKELQLYFETKEFSASGISSIMIYRASNMKKVAIGRIFLDPLHPKHYALYLYSRGLVYVPRAVVVGALSGGGYYVTQEFLKFISDLSSEQ